MTITKVRAMRGKDGALVAVQPASETEGYEFRGRIYATALEAETASEIAKAEATLRDVLADMKSAIERLLWSNFHDDGDRCRTAEGFAEDLFPTYGGRNESAEEFVQCFERASVITATIAELRASVKS